MLIELGSHQANSLEQFYERYKGLQGFLNLYTTSEVTYIDTPYPPPTHKIGCGCLLFNIKSEEFLGFISGLISNLKTNYLKEAGGWEPEHIIVSDVFYDRASLFIFDIEL